MNEQENGKSTITKPVAVSLIAGLSGLLSFFLMFNWKYGEFLITPTLIFGFICLITGIVSTRRMISSKEKMLGNNKTYMLGFGILVGVCILTWFCIALFTHN